MNVICPYCGAGPESVFCDYKLTGTQTMTGDGVGVQFDPDPRRPFLRRLNWNCSRCDFSFRTNGDGERPT